MSFFRRFFASLFAPARSARAPGGPAMGRGPTTPPAGTVAGATRAGTVAGAAPHPSPTTRRPAASHPGAAPRRRCSRAEVELALLLPFLTEAERSRFLLRLAQVTWRGLPWPESLLTREPREQLQEWAPFEEGTFANFSVPGVCASMQAEMRSGLHTIQTPPNVLSRPVRMYWLLCQGRRIGQGYAALERLLGDRRQALEYAWWLVAEL